MIRKLFFLAFLCAGIVVTAVSTNAIERQLTTLECKAIALEELERTGVQLELKQVLRFNSSGQRADIGSFVAAVTERARKLGEKLGTDVTPILDPTKHVVSFDDGRWIEVVALVGLDGQPLDEAVVNIFVKKGGCNLIVAAMWRRSSI